MHVPMCRVTDVVISKCISIKMRFGVHSAKGSNVLIFPRTYVHSANLQCLLCTHHSFWPYEYKDERKADSAFRRENRPDDSGQLVQ